jgi:putative membrane protein
VSVAIALRAIAAYYATRDLQLRVDGVEALPRRGAAVLAVRHYHHLYDGVALVRGLPRLPRIFVALDWARTPGQRFAMETLCKLAEWPVSLRSENVTAATGAFAPRETLHYVRRSIAAAAALLRQGKVLAVFPEAYPTIDPAGSRKEDAAFLPFRPGLLAIVAAAERAGSAPVPILPVGLQYARAADGRWQVAMRLGDPLFLSQAASRPALLQELATRVRELSL